MHTKMLHKGNLIDKETSKQKMLKEKWTIKQWESHAKSKRSHKKELHKIQLEVEEFKSKEGETQLVKKCMEKISTNWRTFMVKRQEIWRQWRCPAEERNQI